MSAYQREWPAVLVRLGLAVPYEQEVERTGRRRKPVLAVGSRFRVKACFFRHKPRSVPG